MERRKDAEAKAREIDGLKAEARRELADLEAHANTRPLSPEDAAAKTVDWFDNSGSGKITGVLLRVDCIGKQLRLSVKDDEGKTQKLLVPDPQQFEIVGADGLTCGAQKSRRVTVSYKPQAQPVKGVSGKSAGAEATGIEFRQ